MSPHAIHIFGASGSGTSTLGRALSDALGYFFMDTDSYFWEETDPPYTAKRPAADRLALMRADIAAHGNVVISGSLSGWGDGLIPDFTLAIRLVTDTTTRIQRLKEREFAHFGARIRPGGDMYAAHEAFLSWAAQYDGGGLDMRSRQHHDAWQTLLRCPLLVLDGTQRVEDLVRTVRMHL